MKKKYNVLVTGTGSYGIGEGLIKTIKNSVFRDQIRLIGASNSQLTAYKNEIDRYYILPNAVDKAYISSLLNLLQEENINILIPGSEAELAVISESKQHLSNTELWMNPAWIIEIFNDKFKSQIFLEKNKLEAPETYAPGADSVKFPLILKPIKGKSSENIHVVHNLEQLHAVEALFKAYKIKYIVQEFITGGEEYTVSLVNVGNTAPEIFILKRILNKGATQYITYENNKEIEAIALKLHQVIKEELIVNIQLIAKDNRYYIIEINPRFSGSAPMRALMGFNEFDILFSNKILNSEFKYNIKCNNNVIRGYAEFLY